MKPATPSQPKSPKKRPASEVLDPHLLICVTKQMYLLLKCQITQRGQLSCGTAPLRVRERDTGMLIRLPVPSSGRLMTGSDSSSVSVQQLHPEAKIKVFTPSTTLTGAHYLPKGKSTTLFSHSDTECLCKCLLAYLFNIFIHWIFRHTAQLYLPFISKIKVFTF